MFFSGDDEDYDEDDRREARLRDASQQLDAFDRHGIQVPVGGRYTVNPLQMFKPASTPEETPRRRKGKKKSSKK